MGDTAGSWESDVVKGTTIGKCVCSMGGTAGNWESNIIRDATASRPSLDSVSAKYVNSSSMSYGYTST